MPDFDGPEIWRNLTDAYRFTELNHPEKYPRWRTLGPKGPRAPYAQAEKVVDMLEETNQSVWEQERQSAMKEKRKPDG